MAKSQFLDPVSRRSGTVPALLCIQLQLLSDGVHLVTNSEEDQWNVDLNDFHQTNMWKMMKNVDFNDFSTEHMWISMDLN